MRVAAAALLVLAGGCALDFGSLRGRDAGADAGMDAATRDAASDARSDAGGLDTGIDAGIDAGTDAGPDDAGPDSGLPDAGLGDAGDAGEVDCTNRVDDDSDMAIDCEDLDCLNRFCGPSEVCCSMGSLGCERVNRDDACGGCGLMCNQPTESCVDFTGYACSCTVLEDCPEGRFGGPRQLCFEGICTCTEDDHCAPRQMCRSGRCMYP